MLWSGFILQGERASAVVKSGATDGRGRTEGCSQETQDEGDLAGFEGVSEWQAIIAE